MCVVMCTDVFACIVGTQLCVVIIKGVCGLAHSASPCVVCVRVYVCVAVQTALVCTALVMVWIQQMPLAID